MARLRHTITLTSVGRSHVERSVDVAHAVLESLRGEEGRLVAEHAGAEHDDREDGQDRGDACHVPSSRRERRHPRYRVAAPAPAAAE